MTPERLVIDLSQTYGDPADCKSCRGRGVVVHTMANDMEDRL